MPQLPAIATLGIIPEALTQRFSSHFRLLAPHELDSGNGLQVAVTTSMIGADRQRLDALPDLQLLLCNGAGLDRIDLHETQQRGIEVCNTPDAVTEDTADFAIALLYAVKRRLVQGDRMVRDGAWGKEPLQPSHRVSASKVGIVGLGKIGALVAQRVKAMGAEVAYHTPTCKPGINYPYFASIHQLAAWSDVLILCCPATAATEGLVDHQVLQTLGSQGTLINIARGSVVVEEDLIRSLRDGVLGGAALDVFNNEPNINPQFRSLPNVVLSPHAAAVTNETRNQMAEQLFNRALQYFSPT